MKNKRSILEGNTRVVVPLINGNNNCKKDTSVLDDIVGQDGLKKQLNFFINSVSPSTPFPTVLLTGSKGLGKTYTSSKIAKALGRKMVELNCSHIKDTEDFINNVLLKQVMGEEEVCLLLDESHELQFEVTNFLLSILNTGNKDGKFRFQHNHIDIEYDMNKINVVFATTDAYMMFSPLVNRCREIYLQPYSIEETKQMLKKYASGVNISVDGDDIAYACRKRARNAFSMAQDIIRYCNMQNTNEFNNDGWDYIKDTFGFHDLGLRCQELSMLKVLAEKSPIAVKNLAVILGLNKNNIEDEISIWPRELGLINTESRGISISEEGREYISKI